MAIDRDRPTQVRRVIESAFKALSGHAEATLDFGSVAQCPVSIANRLRLLVRRPTLAIDDLRLLRGAADAAALRIRYHDPRQFAAQMPADTASAAIFDAGEQARVEAIGSRRWAGVAGNLDAFRDAVSLEGSHHLTSGMDATQIGDAFVLWLREKLAARPVPPASRPLLAAWRGELDDRLGQRAVALRTLLGDQAAYGAALLELIGHLRLGASYADNARCRADDKPRPPASAAQAEAAGNSGAVRIEDLVPDVDAEERDATGETPEQASEALEKRADGDAAGRGGGSPLWLQRQGASAAYRPYTVEYDEVVDASELCDAAELSCLRARLDSQVTHTRALVTRLANRLQRRLLAQQLRWWDFDRDEGILDSARLARIVVDPRHALSFKVEKYSTFRDTIVSLLIDNSGSMRGRPIAAAAACTDIIASTLERCGVKVEILGFTTCAWNGGRSRGKWIVDGQPQNPGRLNDLRHIVYKAADTPWRHARRYLALMLSDGLLKGNVDGEALLWACQRLGARSEARRILVVISDGAPVDDVTLAVNPGNYLDRHLHCAIGFIEKHTPIELTAIGIGHDVGRYYRRAVTIHDLDELGDVLLRDLIDLFDAGLHRQGRRAQAAAPGTRRRREGVRGAKLGHGPAAAAHPVG
jgi:cobaltochelatase CobT